MANTELAIRFTENFYATKNEVSKELKMSLIDNIWSNILSYRSNFNHYLTIKTIDKFQLTICLCPTVHKSVTDLETKLLKAFRNYIKLTSDSGSLRAFEGSLSIKALMNVAKKYGIEANESYIRSLINGEIKNVDDNSLVLIRYLKALKLCKDKYANPIDMDFLADIFSAITGNDEITSFYRTKNEINPENRVLISRVYTSAPCELIDTMMTSLFNFIAQSNLSILVKALTVYYYITYIKPFDTYNDLIALVLAKALLAHSDSCEGHVYIPFETILNANTENLNKISIEVQKTHDITYFYIEAGKILNAAVDEALNAMTNIAIDDLKNDFYQAEMSQSPVVEEAPKVQTEAKINTETAEKKQSFIVSNPTEGMAINSMPSILDERSVQKIAEHLMELDPSLKKSEAHFYAKHCTLGKKYTIQQFKKSEGCAYETARTSMEHLVNLGYFRKETLKNKFVYAPIRRN